MVKDENISGGCKCLKELHLVGEVQRMLKLLIRKFSTLNGAEN